MIVNAFTCTGSYAILILCGIKRAENRSVWPSPSEGRAASSCSKSFCKEEYGRFIAWASANLTAEDFEKLPSWREVKDWSGRIVGACDYASRKRNDLVLTDGDERGGNVNWDEGYDYWWDLSEVVAFDHPIPCRGNVGMWQLPSAFAAHVTAVDRLARSVGERIASSENAAELFCLAMPIAGVNEGFFVLPLDESRRVIAEPVLVSIGDASTTTVDPGEVFSAALQVSAKAIVVAHNHPSGDITPSAQDYEFTDQLKWLGTKIGVEVLDHLIVSGEQWCVVERN